MNSSENSIPGQLETRTTIKKTTNFIPRPTSTVPTDDEHARAEGVEANSAQCQTCPTGISCKVSEEDKELEEEWPEDDLPPLYRFKKGYLSVTDLTSQCWCEKQTEYALTIPHLVEPSAAMQAGASMHLARELEVHDLIEVKTTSLEDTWALRLINTVCSLRELATTSPTPATFREVVVFGEPLSLEVFMVGIIDELTFDPSTNCLKLVEFKTRQSKSLPGASQKKSHALQVWLYKLLYNGLVSGGVSRSGFLQGLWLREDVLLGLEVMRFAKAMLGFEGTTIGDLVDAVLLQVQFLHLPLIDSCQIEYRFQGDSGVISTEAIDLGAWRLRTMLDKQLGYWKGQRQAEGVDIEEAWKCSNCDFSSICDWRKDKITECIHQNKISN